MTFGELAQYFNGEFDLGVDLEVVEMQGYDRSESYAELDIPFVMPSPNMPTTDSIDVYPITGLFETFVQCFRRSRHNKTIPSWLARTL